MKTSTIVSIVVVIIIIFGGWWLLSSHSMTSTTAPVAQNTTPATTPEASTAHSPSTPATPPANPQPPVVVHTSTPVIKVSTSATLGSYLASSLNGMTLYTYSKDSANVSNCTGSCAANWPPYTPAGSAPFVVVGSVSGKISTFTRADGTLQLSYNGKPLYFWVNDSKPGDTTGQNVGGFVIAKP